MGTQRTDRQSGLLSALFPAVRQRVLASLFGQPDKDFSTSDMIRLAGSGTGAVHRELTRLSKAGLVNVTVVGNQRRYRANQESPIFGELRGLVLKTVGLVDPIRQVLSKYHGQIDAAFIFGSIARGSDRAASDVDLMLVSDDLTYGEVYSALQDAEASVGRSIDLTLTSRVQWQKELMNENSLASRISAQPKLFVIGSEDGLRAS
jgi:predicted nucleotidyltransferase